MPVKTKKPAKFKGAKKNDSEKKKSVKVKKSSSKKPRSTKTKSQPIVTVSEESFQSSQNVGDTTENIIVTTEQVETSQPVSEEKKEMNPAKEEEIAVSTESHEVGDTVIAATESEIGTNVVVEPANLESVGIQSPVNNDQKKDQFDLEEHNTPFLIIAIICVSLLVLLGGGAYYYYSSQVKTQPKMPVVVKQSLPTAMPTPTPTIDLTQYKIEILNGSGISGEAARAKTLLEGDSFTVDSIGNASNSAFTKTIIQAKEPVASVYLDKLKADLGTTYDVSDVQVLSDKEKVDVIVTVGSKKSAK